MSKKRKKEEVEMFMEHKKDEIKNCEFSIDVNNHNFSRKEFIKVFAVNKTFKNVNFSQTNMRECYFRKCKFIKCNFTGTSFKDCYLKGATFPESKFIYTTFNNSYLDDSILDNSLPSEENLARDFVRNLRVNFLQIGNYEAVNKAAAIEVKLTGKHLYNAAYSREAYYRGKEKYSGFGRIKSMYSYAKWKFLDYLWGNGESLLRIIISMITFIIIISISLYMSINIQFIDSMESVFYQFWGISSEIIIPKWYIVTLTISRLIFFSLFISILVKRLGKR